MQSHTENKNYKAHRLILIHILGLH